jgi:hypothetical protein
MQYQPSLNADRIEDFRELLTGNRTTLHVSVNFLAKPAFFARDRGTMIRREEIKSSMRFAGWRYSFVQGKIADTDQLGT